MELEQQIVTQMRRAMLSRMQELFRSSEFTESDIDWIKRLCKELVQRINKLTPNRTALHHQLERSVDVDLLGQMLQHGAVEETDVRSITTAIFERLSELCAPVQDVHVQKLKNSEMDIGTLLFEANAIVDEIENLKRKIATI